VADAPPFEIIVDKHAGLVSTVLRGFWTMDDLNAFGAGMYVAVQSVAARHPVFALISDSTDFKVQSTEVSEGFAQMMDMGNRSHAGPAAIVVGSALNKLQAERVFTDPRVRIFIDKAEARRWIDEELALVRAA
jgi:hypothetical protein